MIAIQNLFKIFVWFVLKLFQVKILSMLDHPNIISYFDHFEEDGVLIIEMEYADGG